MSSAGVVLAGGSGTRVGAAGNKVYLPLAGRPVLAWSLDAFARAGVEHLVLVTRPQDRDLALDVLAQYVLASHVEVTVDIISGGPTRHASETLALAQLTGEIEDGSIDVVAIHDGARPLAAQSLIREILAEARLHGGAVPGIEVTDLAGQDAGRLRARDNLGAVRVQTPQAFRALPLLRSYEQAADVGFAGSDTAACVARFSDLTIQCLPGDPRNLKITYARDLLIAERLLAAQR